MAEGEEMHQMRANELVQAYLAGNARESQFYKARLGTFLHCWRQAQGLDR